MQATELMQVTRPNVWDTASQMMQLENKVPSLTAQRGLVVANSGTYDKNHVM
jgi:hypothetical protein